MHHVAAGLILRGFLILLLSFTTAWAQATAQLNGTVKDQSGANPTLAVALALGQIEETVSVQGSTALVETRTSGSSRRRPIPVSSSWR